jgi:type IV secretory pathway TraG/TraD family ATPase VirD4
MVRLGEEKKMKINMNVNKQQDITLFAETNFRNQGKRFGIKEADRRYHMYVIGKTGMGKTSLLENLIVSDIRNENGLAILDPHGDLIERLLDLIPSYRINDVIYFNPADQEYPVALNILENVKPELRSVLVSGILSVFKMFFREYWGPRMEHVFRSTLLTALRIPGASLFTVVSLLTDVDFRERVTKRLEDDVLRAFWEKQFNILDKRQRTEAILPILNKIGQFLADPLIRNIVGQRKNKIHFREVIDKKRILLANLSKGKIGEDNAALLGSLLLTKLQLAALSRSDILEANRQDFYLYIDECHNFVTESLASMLPEMRKYQLNMILANQHLEQLNETIRTAILGNVGSLIVFRVGAEDADVLKEEFFPTFSKVDFVRLPKYQIYLRLMIDGLASDGFSANSLQPSEGKSGHKEKIIRVSRERYGVNSKYK